MSPSDPVVGGYRTAVAKMQQLSMQDPADPRGWTYQANMHGTYDPVPAGADWNQCQHGSFLFLSWHRMYVYYFERIVRSFSGIPGQFALPYWNYTSTSASHRALPEAFRMPANTTNALYVEERNRDPGGLDINDGDSIPYSATLYSVAMAYTNFSSPPGSSQSFGGQRANAAMHSGIHGQLERQPHDVMHGMIGGDGWMGDPNTAARDPIFWLHHANIDRLWKRWLDQGGRVNPGEAFWLDHNFAFYDENKQLVQLSGKQVVDTAQQLNYRYDDDPAPVLIAAAPALAAQSAPTPPAQHVVLASAPEPSYSLAGDSKTIAVPIAESSNQHMLAVASGEKKQRLALRVERLQFDRNPGIYYEVYVDLPQGAQPDPQSIYYVGNVGFFGRTKQKVQPDEHAGMAGHLYSFDVTNLVRELTQTKQWNDKQVDVTFVPRGLEKKGQEQRKIVVPEGSNIRFAKVTLVSE